MTEEISTNIPKMQEDLDMVKKDINKIFTNDLVHIKKDIGRLDMNIQRLNLSFIKDMGITISITISSFILIIVGIITNFLFYSVAGLLLLILSLIHVSGKKQNGRT